MMELRRKLDVNWGVIKVGIDVGSVEFWGNQAELLEFAEALSSAAEVTLRADPTVRPPWTMMAERIRIVPTGANAAVMVGAEGDVVVIWGGSESLRRIAEGIRKYFGKEFSSGKH